jgi:hypothetical protein
MVFMGIDEEGAPGSTGEVPPGAKDLHVPVSGVHSGHGLQQVAQQR